MKMVPKSILPAYAIQKSQTFISAYLASFCTEYAPHAANKGATPGEHIAKLGTQGDQGGGGGDGAWITPVDTFHDSD